jgi:hypothetical protein
VTRLDQSQQWPSASATIAGQDSWYDGVLLRGEASLGDGEIDLRQGPDACEHLCRIRSYLCAEAAQDSLHLTALFELSLLPGITDLDRLERLNKQGSASRRDIVDNASQMASELWLDWQHIAVVSLGNKRLLDPALILGTIEEASQPAHEPLVLLADLASQRGQERARRVKHLASRTYGASQRALKLR